MDAERRPAYPGTLFTQDELVEMRKWAKDHNEFDVANWEPRDSGVVLESIAVKLDTLIRTTKSIKRWVEILGWVIVGIIIAMLLK
jgi:hypothetical protein